MEPQVVVQQGGMTFGQFVWVWIGGMCFLGALFIIGGWTFSRNKTAGKTQVRQALQGLISSGTLREEDVTPALNAAHLPPAPEEMSGQMWLERVLAGAPGIEQLIRFWKRPLWVEASLYAGLGMFLASGVSAIVFLILPPDPQSSASIGLMFAVLLSLPMMGMLIGLGVGLFKGIFKGVASLEHRLPGQESIQERQPREMTRYHLRWLLWGGIILFCLPCFLLLSVPFFSPIQSLGVVVVGLGVLPVLTLAGLLFDEYAVRRLAFLPPVQMGTDPVLAERIDTLYFFPRLVASLRFGEYGLLGTMAVGQALLTLSSSNRGADEVYAQILLGMVAFYVGFPFLLGWVQQGVLLWQWLRGRRSKEQSLQEDGSSGEESTPPPPTT